MKNLLPRTLLASAAALLAFSCQESEVTPNPSVDGAISFRTQIATRINDISFEEDDQISVAAFTDNQYANLYEDYALYTQHDGTFVSPNPIYANGDLSFFACYPATPEDFANEFKCKVFSDQREGQNFDFSNLMIAKAEATSELTPQLVFSHKFSRLNVKVTANFDITEAVVKVLDVKMQGTYNIAEDVVTATDEVVYNVTMKNDEANIYQGILLPQSVEPNSEFVSVEVDGKEYVAVIDKKATLEMGKEYFFEMTIEKESEKVTFESSINGWEEGEIVDPNEGGGEDPVDPDAPVIETTLEAIPTDGSVAAGRWVITDSQVFNKDIFANLKTAISLANGEVSLEFPNLTKFPTGALGLYGDNPLVDNLVSVSAPLATTVSGDAFSSCANLKVIDLPIANNIENYAMDGLDNLEKLTICTNSSSAKVQKNMLGTQHCQNVTLYVGLNSVTGATTSVDPINGTAWTSAASDVAPIYFKEVVFVGEDGGNEGGNEGGDETTNPTFEAADFMTMTDASGIDGDTWVITDAAISSSNAMMMCAVIESATGREISLEFPNLLELPANTITTYSPNGIVPLVSISAPKVTKLAGEAAIGFCPNLKSVKLPSLVEAAAKSISTCGIEELTMCVNSFIVNLNQNMFYNVMYGNTVLYVGSPQASGAQASGNTLLVFNSDGGTATFQFKSINVI